MLNTFAGEVNLIDKNGFVAGLPFEGTATCSNVIYTPDNGVAEFNWLNSRLDSTTNPTTPTPEPSSLVLLGVGIVGIVSILVYGPPKAKWQCPRYNSSEFLDDDEAHIVGRVGKRPVAADDAVQWNRLTVDLQSNERWNATRPGYDSVGDFFKIFELSGELFSRASGH